MVVLVGVVALGGATWLYIRDSDPFRPDRTVTIADLAPSGYRQALVTFGPTFVIGERADGRAEVVTLESAGDSTRRQRSTGKGPWASARAIGSWMALFPRPTPEGTRTVEVFDGTRHATIELAKGEDIMFPSGGHDRLHYVVFAAATGTLRSGDTASPEPRQVNAPPGATLAGSFNVDSNGVTVAGPDGRVYSFTVGNPRVAIAPTPVPPGHPGALFVHDHQAGVTWYAENKAGYQVFRNGTAVFKGAPDRTPVRIAMCRPKQPELCVFDEVNNAATTTGLTVYRFPEVPDLVSVPHAAAVPTASTATVLIVPTLAFGSAGSITVNARGPATTFDGTLLQVYDNDAVLVPSRPVKGAATADWAATPQSITIMQVDLNTGSRKKLETVTARPGSCGAANGRMACAGRDDFTVWRLRL
ncbi:hypothetical protein GCM10009557_44990 [Virgisporangium ochraceum]